MFRKTIVILISILLVNGANYSQTRFTACNAYVANNSVKIDFTMSPGTSCGGYQIFRSTDSTNVLATKIYDYPGVCGDINTSQNFSYIDYGPALNTMNYYKVLIPPFDYSNLLKLYVNQTAAAPKVVVYPQPATANDILNIYIENEDNTYYELKIYDSFGRLKLFKIGTYASSIHVPTSSFDEGVFVFLIIDGNGKIFKGKFSKD